MSPSDRITQLAGPVLLVVLVAALGSLFSRAHELEFRNAIVAVSIVVALYLFVGNSGVISFGHVSFVAVGAFTAALLTIPLETKRGVFPDLFPVLRDHSVGSAASLVLAACVGGAFALLVGIPLMRLSGLAAGIATLAVLGITYNLLRYWTKIGPGAQSIALIPETTSLLQAAAGAIAVVAVAYAYQWSRFGRMLRATREDPAAAQAVGIDITRQRLWAFALSGALSGFAGGLLVHLAGSITTEAVYLDLTLLSLAMLVIGGVSSLWGAVVGALLISGLDSFLSKAEDGVDIGFRIDAPEGTAVIVLGTLMAGMLLLRPSGLTGGHEFSLRLLRRREGVGRR